ncbi:MAG: elongation factor G [Pseudomonadota bacterium]
MSKCIAILGPNGVGKSTLTDRLCGLEGGPAPTGLAQEIRIGTFDFLDERWSVMDCPGSLEFLQSSMDALMAADVAVVTVSPAPDAAVLAAPYLKLAEEAGVPTILFVNRMDEAEASARQTIEALQGYSAHPIVLRQIPIREDGAIIGAVDLVSERAWRYQKGKPSELVEIPSDLLDRETEARGAFLENLSEYDDWLLEELIEDRVPANDEVYSICTRVLAGSNLVPAFIGCAEKGNGVFRLMKALRHETPDVSALADRLGGAMAVSCMARHRKHVGKTVTLRALARVKTGDTLGGDALGPISVADGDKFAPASDAAPGQIFTAIKSDHLESGQLYAAAVLNPPSWYQPLPPLLRHAIVPQNDRDDAKLSQAIAKVVSEDRSLTAEHDAETGAHVLAGQGILHLRNARTVLADIFGVETEERPVTPALRETITKAADVHYRHKKQSGGAGQFADVKLTVQPGARGSGFAFTEKIHGGSVPKNYIPAVEAGCAEATDRGPLGFPIVDIAVILYDGQHHNVDSSDMAFKIAGRGAVRQAMEEAGAVLLEPIYEVTFTVPSVFTGALNPLVSSRRGQVLGYDRVEGAEGWDALRAQLPGGALDDLIADLRSATQGVGRYTAVFDHYQELYGKDADTMIETRARALEPA